MHAVVGSARAREMRMSEDAHFVNERDAREADLVALGKLQQLATSRTFIFFAYRICARGNVYCGNV